MEPIIIIIFACILVFLLLGIPIGFAIGLAILVGMIYDGSLELSFFIQKMISSLNLFPLLAVPFFIMAGEIMMKGTMATRLLGVSRALVGHITGGMAQVTVLTSLFYGALSGSGPATVAAVGGIMIPSMEKEKYKKSFSTAVSTAAGSLGVLIPPSVPLIIYGVATGVSVGDLFIAGVIPGILFAMGLMLVSYIIAKKHGYKGKEKRSSFKEFISALNNAKFALLVPVIVLGGIYGGVATPTEAAVIATVYALFIEGIVHRELTIAKLYDILKSTILTTASIFIVVATATTLGDILTVYNIPDQMVAMLLAITDNPILLLLLINLFLLIIGTFMDALASILILGPLLLPVAVHIGMDPIHFGIMLIINLSLGFITPPVGVNLFVGSGIGKISIERLSIAVFPFLLMSIAVLMLITFIPGFSLFLLN